MLFYRLLQQAILADPITYRSLIMNPQPGRPRPVAAAPLPNSPDERQTLARPNLTQIDTPLLGIARDRWPAQARVGRRDRRRVGRLRSQGYALDLHHVLKLTLLKPRPKRGDVPVRLRPAPHGAQGPRPTIDR